MRKKVELFVDGACRGNPGPGGFGVLLRYNGVEKTLKGAQEQTTNNRMELLAAITGLKALKVPCEVAITTDSQYVRKGMIEWVHNWQKNGWRNASKAPVKNEDLWRELLLACEGHHVEWHWVKGHSGHSENELADQLANQAIDELLGT
ncbi:MAG TPA: ribonuclease HI [Gammaproteobacteria bacterium]|nr:ribonuclease HI [Gammaproteobacteria bacterium]